MFPHHDFYRARQASLAVERQYRLTSTSPADRTADSETTRGERRKHQDALRARAQDGRAAPPGPDREVLRARVRAALAGSHSWQEFTDRLRDAGVMLRQRYSTLNPGQLTGYAVALPQGGPETSNIDQLIWFGGGKLAPDLSLPQLQARWPATGGNAATAASGHAHDRAGRSGEPPERGAWLDRPRLSELERRQLWSTAHDAVRQADEQIRQASTPGAGTAEQTGAQAAATAASEMLHAVSRLVEGRHGGPLRTAADAYDRAARDLHRRTVPTTARSRRTRSAAGALLSARLVRRGETRQLLALLAHLTALSQSLARLRETQGRAAQAQAARRAAEQLAAEHAWRAAAASAAAPASKARAPFVRLPTTPGVRPARLQESPTSRSR